MGINNAGPKYKTNNRMAKVRIDIYHSTSLSKPKETAENYKYYKYVPIVGVFYVKKYIENEKITNRNALLRREREVIIDFGWFCFVSFLFVQF